MERKKQYDEKLLRILDSACRVFAEEGYHKASIRDIATETGVSPAGLYYYFKSKEELLFLILDARLGSLLDRIREETSEIDDPTLRLRTIVSGHLSHFVENQEGMRVLVREWETLSGSFGKQIRGLMREYTELVARTLQELAPQRDARELRAATFGLFGMLTWVDQWHRPDQDIPMDALSELYSDLLLEGFSTLSPSPQAKERAEGSEPGKAWSKKDAKSSILSGPGF